MSRTNIDQLLYLMDEAFQGQGEHSLLANLRSLKDDDWLWLPPGGGRSIFDLVVHVGECKYVYDNHAFGDGSMRWDRPGTVPAVERGASATAIIDWLRRGQGALRGSVASLAEDGGLLRERRANWGQSYQPRWLINVTIQHDLCHAGETNHIRALRQGNDRWPWAQE